MNFPAALLAATLACLSADVSWFLFGRRYGHVVLRLLCRFSLESSTCVRRTHESFGRRGAYTLLFAKFVPGLSVVAPPVAGQTGMSMRRFLAFDAVGSIVWSGSLLLAGRLFGDLLAKDPSVLDWLGRFGGALLILGILGFIGTRIYRRHSYLKKVPHRAPRARDFEADAGRRRAGLHRRPASSARTCSRSLHAARRTSRFA
jgi:membrane protein DedA with SNARE-associated domain